MTKRTPDVYLSAKELEARALETKKKAQALREGQARDRALKDAHDDESMAVMKRWIGEIESTR